MPWLVFDWYFHNSAGKVSCLSASLRSSGSLTIPKCHLILCKNVEFIFSPFSYWLVCSEVNSHSMPSKIIESKQFESHPSLAFWNIASFSIPYPTIKPAEVVIINFRDFAVTLINTDLRSLNSPTMDLVLCKKRKRGNVQGWQVGEEEGNAWALELLSRETVECYLRKWCDHNFVQARCDQLRN